MPTRNYSLFSQAESLNMTAYKLLTGQDAPVSGMEMLLWNTYRLVTKRLQDQDKKHGKGRRR